MSITFLCLWQQRLLLYEHGMVAGINVQHSSLSMAAEVADSSQGSTYLQTQIQADPVLSSLISFSSLTFPGAPYRIFLLFLAWLPCHFYLDVIEQQQQIYEHGKVAGLEFTLQSQTGKATTIQRSDVSETGVCRHYLGLIEGALENPRTSQHYDTEGFQEALNQCPIKPRDTSLFSRSELGPSTPTTDVQKFWPDKMTHFNQ